MTRINCIDPQELHQKHLVAEYREITRVFGLVRKHLQTKNVLKVPTQYTLGTGHVKFFYDKLTYISKRYSSLIDEMKRRGYKPSYENTLDKDFCDIPEEYWNDWQPDDAAKAINTIRIIQRMPK